MNFDEEMDFIPMDEMNEEEDESITEENIDDEISKILNQNKDANSDLMNFEEADAQISADEIENLLRESENIYNNKVMNTDPVKENQLSEKPLNSQLSSPADNLEKTNAKEPEKEVKKEKDKNNKNKVKYMIMGGVVLFTMIGLFMQNDPILVSPDVQIPENNKTVTIQSNTSQSKDISAVDQLIVANECQSILDYVNLITGITNQEQLIFSKFMEKSITDKELTRYYKQSLAQKEEIVTNFYKLKYSNQTESLYKLFEPILRENINITKAILKDIPANINKMTISEKTDTSLRNQTQLINNLLNEITKTLDNWQIGYQLDGVNLYININKILQ